MKSKAMEGHEALELVELLDRLRGISLTDLAVEQRAGLTPQERMIEDLTNNKSVQRSLRDKSGGTRAKKPKPHWKTEAKRRKLRYANYLKPKRIKEKALRLTTAEGWWEEQSLIWRNEAAKKRDTSFVPKVTQEEFCEVLYPAFVGRVPIFKRLDTSKGVSLENLYIVDVDTDQVLFDGAEYYMRLKGYIV